MFNAESETYFYLSELDLERLSEKFPNKPYSFVFYRFLVDMDFLNSEISISRFSNFLMKVHELTGIWEVRFSDGSVFYYGDGRVNVVSEKVGYHATFPVV